MWHTPPHPCLPAGMWVPAGQAIGKSLLEEKLEEQDLSGVGQGRRERGVLRLTCMLCSRWLWTAPAGRGAPPPPPPFTSYIVSTPPGGFPPPQGFPQGYGAPPQFSKCLGPVGVGLGHISTESRLPTPQVRAGLTLSTWLDSLSPAACVHQKRSVPIDPIGPAGGVARACRLAGRSPPPPSVPVRPWAEWPSVTRDPRHCSFVALPWHASHPTTKSGSHSRSSPRSLSFLIGKNRSLFMYTHTSHPPGTLGLECGPTHSARPLAGHCLPSRVIPWAAGWAAGVDACGPGS